MKKTISIILAILMVVTMLPMAVLPAGAVSQKQDGFTVYVTYGVCKYCGDKHAADDVNIKSISVQNGKVTFQLSVEFKNRGDCSKTANVKAYSGVDTTYYYFTYTITDDFSCEQSYLINESYGQNFGEDKPKLLYSISRNEGHQASSWAFNGTKHSGTCELCGKTVNDNCSGGTATCMEKATCSTCGNKYGSLASDNHDWSNLDGICANGCGAECDHKWGDGTLVRPTKTKEGYYTYTCSACDATKTEAAQRAANYAEYTKALNDLRAYLDSDKLTDDVKASVAEWLEIYDSDEAYKFIAGEEETVTLYIEAALYYATEIETAIQDCLAGNHSGNGEYCDICGAALHTCDFTGAWKFDDKYHWKECDCGNVAQKATHPYGPTCTCGYVCPHAKTYTLITRPVQNADGTWGKGEIVEICNICGNSSLVQEVERDHEGYKVFDETALELEAILNSGKMTDTWKNDYTNRLNGLRNSAYYQVYTEIETAIPSMTESLKSIIAEIEAGLADGTMIKADFTYMTSLFDEINALIDNDPNKLIPSESGRFQGIYYGYYMSCKNDGNHSQADYDQNMAGNNWEGQIEAILAGIKDGSALKADYTAIDEAIVKLDEKLADENLTDEAKAELEEIKAELEEMKKNPLSSKADLAGLEKALEVYETEVDAGIEDGSAVKVNGKAIVNKMLDEWGEKILADGLGDAYIEFIDNNKATEEALAEDDEIQKFAESLVGSVAENADNIKQLEGMVSEFLAYFENCLSGAHNVREYKVIEAAKCGENAVEEGACWFCGEIVTREAEDTALTHTDADGDYICDNGCGHEFEKPAPEEPSDDVCEDCGRPAHEGEINEFICLILSFLKLLYTFIMAIK